MARYIDSDNLSEQITTEYCGKCGVYNGELCCSCPMNDALRYIEDFPTDDVAPRAELAREIFEELTGKLTEQKIELQDRVHSVKDPDAIDGVYNEIDTLEWVLDFVAVLKKKYTEEK